MTGVKDIKISIIKYKNQREIKCVKFNTSVDGKR